MYNSYVDDIFRYLLVNVRDRQLAEDLTADTFTKAWTQIDKFDFKQPRPWLYKIAKNTMTDYWRKKKPEPMPEEESVSDRDSIEDEVNKRIMGDKVVEAVSHLPEDMRSVVSLRFMSGYSAKQTAQSLGLSEANVRVIQYRALKKLKMEMK